MALVLLIGLATFISTLLGGLLALKIKDHLKLILGFSAGAVVGVALFDLLPESLSVGINGDYLKPASLIAVGFFIYMFLDRILLIHTHHDEDCENESHNSKLGAGSLTIHSLLDGIGIGLAYKVSPAIGGIVAIGVLTHDFSDGINTVNLVLRNKGKLSDAYRWLIFDAVAPIVGIVLTLFVAVGDGVLSGLLAMFCGLFLYIGASDLVPESHRRYPKMFTTLTTFLGMLVIYLAIRLIHAH